MLAVAAMISFTACEKDGGEEVLPSYIQVGEKYYDLGGAVGYFNQHNEGQKRFYLSLTDKVYWNDKGDWQISIEGSQRVEVSLSTLTAQNVEAGKLPEGKFTYSEEIENLKHSGFAEYKIRESSQILSPFVFFGQANVAESQLVIEIKHVKGKVYEIKFTGGVDEEGNAVSGQYQGIVDIFEMELM